MLNAIESFVKGALPPRALADGYFTLSTELGTRQTGLLFADNKRFPLQTTGWYAVGNRHRKSLGSLAVRTDLSAEFLFSTGRNGARLYLPFVTFLSPASGVLPGTTPSRHADAFWAAIKANYPNKRFLVFQNPRAEVCGFLESLLDTQGRDDWLMLLEEHDRVVVPPAADLNNYDVPVGTWGTIPVIGAIEPRLVRWVTP